MADTAPLVALRCDGTRRTGSGHVMRCLALAEGLADAGMRVALVGAVDDAGPAKRQVAASGLPLHPAPDDGALLAQLDELAASALVIDSYDVGHETYSAVRATGRPVVAVVDAPAPQLDADLLVNQNPGAEKSMRAPHRGRVLAGPRYAMLRSSVTALRTTNPVVRDAVEHVLVVLGGTDVRQAAPRVTALLLRTGLPVHVHAVCADPMLQERVEALPVGPGQSVTTHAPLGDLAALAAQMDVVVTAAGTTTLELACLGKAMALVLVAENQRPGYAALVASGGAVGLGPDHELEESPGGALRELLTSDERRREVARAAHALVDGRGRGRVSAEVRSLLIRRYGEANQQGEAL